MIQKRMDMILTTRGVISSSRRLPPADRAEARRGEHGWPFAREPGPVRAQTSASPPFLGTSRISAGGASPWARLDSIETKHGPIGKAATAAGGSENCRLVGDAPGPRGILVDTACRALGRQAAKVERHPISKA